MPNSPMDFDTLIFFQEHLGLGREELKNLDPYRTLFIDRKEEFAASFYSYFYRIPRTRIILQHESTHGILRETWAQWFETLFNTSWDESFFAQVWKGGLKHVEINLDQRFVNLGYCIVRQFCHQIIGSEIPVGSRGSVILAVDKMLDLCLLVETNAYMVATSHCDREVIKGISHQIRNPITVIGGTARRLGKRFGQDQEIATGCENIVTESRRLERLVVDIGAYIDMFQHDASYTIVSLESLISGALHRLADKQPREAELEIELDQTFPEVQGDPVDLEVMFTYLLENSFEALLPSDPRVRITSRLKSFASNFIEVEIFNTGSLPKVADIESLFAPFYSMKPTGTGFGLPIAQLAAKKNLASLLLVPAGEGTRCLITLPLPG